jgi:hypothetical protein
MQTLLASACPDLSPSSSMRNSMPARQAAAVKPLGHDGFQITPQPLAAWPARRRGWFESFARRGLIEVEFLQYSRTRPVGLVEEGDTVEIADVDGNPGDR